MEHSPSQQPAPERPIYPLFTLWKQRQEQRQTSTNGNQVQVQDKVRPLIPEPSASLPLAPHTPVQSLPPPAARTPDRAPAQPVSTPSPVSTKIAVILPSSTTKHHSFFSSGLQDDYHAVSNLLTPLNQVSASATTHSKLPSSTSARPAPSSQVLLPLNKRGRPRGWRPGLSYAEMRRDPLVYLSDSPAPRPSTVRRPRPSANDRNGGTAPPARRRARQSNGAGPTAQLVPRAIYKRLKPVFIDFLCEWRGCPAKLHNADTLRRHLRLVHAHPTPTLTPTTPASLPCLWGRCGDAGSVLFANSAALEAHLETEHLVPLVWHVGDGPRNSPRGLGGGQRRVPADINGTDGDGLWQGGGDEALPDFLFDAHGNQVTPSIRGQRIEDPVTRRNNKRKLRELLARLNDSLPDPEPEEIEYSCAEG